MSFLPAYLAALPSDRQILMRAATGDARGSANGVQAPTEKADRCYQKPQRHIETAEPLAVEALLEGA
jgi:hypothetical protein